MRPPLLISLILPLFTTPLASSGGIPDYDFQWATISDPGNPGYFNPPEDHNIGRLGRGNVDYEYRISKNEVTTAQWIEFVNTFSTRDDENAYYPNFSSFGMQFDPTYSGPGVRLRPNPAIPNADLFPVTNVSWRDAARYINWLHHGKPNDLATIQDGVYDTSSFGTASDGGWSDQVVRSPGSKFWIPSVSEWIKAVHWDPNKDGPGQGGWWRGPYGSDDLPVTGLPGDPGAQTSFGLDVLTHEAFSIPLGAYPDAQTPWGLLDVSGGASEMLEGWWEDNGPHQFMPNDGMPAGSMFTSGALDQAHWIGGWFAGPSGSGYIGLRIASAVPSPASVFVLCGGTTLLLSRRRR